MTIEEFIEARLCEREASAREAVEIEQKYTPEGHSYRYEWARILINPAGRRQGSFTFAPGAPSPEEALRQYAALRAGLAFGDGLVSPSQQVEFERDVLPPLAAIWADHRDYRAEWRL